ncbi:DUF916 and DUF3324 domain-containing protein [Lactiplantibacillus fabifermentans]|uniref:Cell surface protein n=1 Tax=Lactiplantibacillus fabifermentans DSM 21115 TaxID=1413187 RepID=A0A0R2NQR7_9LACO|nr:DUF916 and DUF3324 domain-containing protein [Lactiplantibacillus fabifermentans]KRO27998.1 cell surface protein [Lactiplantibacillus fabifermentans DSM 21115]
MDKLKKLWLGLVALVGLISFSSGQIQAANVTNNVGYTVKATLPANQINAKNTFFDLRIHAGQTETLRATIYNQTNRDIKVKTAIHTAWTNANGTIDYTNTTNTYDSSLQYPMSTLTKIQGAQTLTIPANGHQVVHATVRVPQTSFNGVILGGWFFKRVDQKVTGTVKGASNIRNAYSYVIGLKYTLGKLPAPTVKLGSVGAGTFNYHRGIIVNLRNPRAIMIPNLTTQTTITNRQTQQVVKKQTQKNVQLAPNTVYRYPLLTGQTALKAGRYHLHMIVKNSSHRWVLDRDFTISASQAKQANAAIGDHQGLSVWLVLALGALAMLILVLLIWLIIVLIRRHKRQNTAE